MPLLVPVSRPVPGRSSEAPKLIGRLKITLEHRSSVAVAYGKMEVTETFGCNYELNPRYRAALEGAGLVVTGENEYGDTRVIELPGRRFFVGTGFIPQLSSARESPHPLITAFLKAAGAFAQSR